MGRARTEPGVKFLGQMRSEGLEENQEIAQHGLRFRFPSDGVVDKNHQGGNGRVEAEAVKVFGDFFDTGVSVLSWAGVGAMS